MNISGKFSKTFSKSGIRRFSTNVSRLTADKSRFVPNSGTYPMGFSVGGINSGVKKNGNLDLAAIVSDIPCTASAVFTQNVFKAAPVVLDKQILDQSGGQGIRSIIINSGNANSVTGNGGFEDALTMVKTVDKKLKISNNLSSTLVMSTGVIGQRLPLSIILDGIDKLIPEKLDSDHGHWLTAAKAIMTTDTFPKMVSQEFVLAGQTYRIAGLTKGAGMINPNMATLLGFFITDAPVNVAALDQALKYSIERSFNSITVDGDTSTNDTIVVLANGAAGGKEITPQDERFPAFQSIMTEFAEKLSQLIVRDGEGATKFVTITVNDAVSYTDAKKVADSIANSPLVKTALYGKDANWGRIVCAIGYAGAEVNPSKTNVSFIPADGTKNLELLVNGEPQNVDEERASEILAPEDINILISLGTGGGHSAKVYTCDFSHEYVSINGDYRS